WAAKPPATARHAGTATALSSVRSKPTRRRPLESVLAPALFPAGAGRLTMAAGDMAGARKTVAAMEGMARSAAANASAAWTERIISNPGDMGGRALGPQSVFSALSGGYDTIRQRR